MEIRLLIPPPWPLLAPLVETSSEEGFQFLIRLEREFLSGEVRFDATGEAFLGAFENSELIGVGGLTRDPYSGEPRTGRVRHVYVLPEWRGRGVGRRILREIERRAIERFDSLVLRTDTSVAANFYQALGYEKLAIGGTATHRRALAAVA